MTTQTCTIESTLETGTAIRSATSPDTGMIPHQSEVSLIEILTELARRKRLIAIVTSVCALLGIVTSFLLPVRYTALTKLMPPQQTQSTSALLMTQLSSAGVSPLAAMAGGLGLKSPNDIYVGMLNSRPVADAIIRKFNLQTIYRDRDMTATRKELAEYTQIASEKSGFISVSVTDRDRKRAADLANEYTQQLRLLTKSIALTEASQRRLFYENQLKDAKDALISSEASFERVQQEKGIVQPDAQARAIIQGLAEIRAQIAAKQVSIQAMRSYSTDRNPDLDIAAHELASLKQQAASLEQRTHSTSGGGLRLRDVPDAGLDFLRTQHEVQYRQTLFDLLVKQYDAARLDEAKDAAVIQTVEPAIEPDRKSSPKRALITIASCLAGIFLGCLMALIQWRSQMLVADSEFATPLRELKQALFNNEPFAPTSAPHHTHVSEPRY
jgi:tyrosine-protein kinase Etk/Wzc